MAALEGKSFDLVELRRESSAPYSFFEPFPANRQGNKRTLFLTDASDAREYSSVMGATRRRSSANDSFATASSEARRVAVRSNGVLFRFAAVTLALTGCAASSSPAPAQPPPSTAVVPIASIATPPAPSPTEPAPPRPDPRSFRFVAKPDGVGGTSCEVVDARTQRVVYSASSKDTAAGGSEVECLDFVAGGKVIRFRNSRGVYAKDARPGPDRDESLPCGDGAFADDLTSCVQTDTSHFAYVGVDDPDAPFDIAICDVAKAAAARSAGTFDSKACNTLVTVPRGLNRYPPTPGDGPLPPSWVARYCSNDRVVVVANGELALFEAPSGKLLSKALAPKQTRITKCADGIVETATGGKSPAARRYRLDRSSLAPLR